MFYEPAGDIDALTNDYQVEACHAELRGAVDVCAAVEQQTALLGVHAESMRLQHVLVERLLASTKR